MNQFGRATSMILLAGVVLRVVVFAYQWPDNNDNHLAVVQYIHMRGDIPASHRCGQCYHPPLYYLLASLLVPFGLKGIQAFSLATSIATLLLLHRFIGRPGAVDPRHAPFCMALAAFLPQFVLFGNYISNDSLSFAIGAALFLALEAYLASGRSRDGLLLLLCLGLGLLTKSSFLACVPPVVAIALWGHPAGREIRRFAIMTAASVVAIAGGCWKQWQNLATNGRPFFHNLDANPPWAASQRPTYVGLSSLYDMNIVTLMREPLWAESGRHSYFLLMYATLWYPYIPESNFFGSQVGYGWVGSLIYGLAVVPTILCLGGIGQTLGTALSAGAAGVSHARSTDARPCDSLALASLLVAGCMTAAVIGLGVRYDVQTCFQSRLLFPCLAAMLVMLDRGLTATRRLSGRLHSAAVVALGCLCAVFLLFFVIEIAVQIHYQPERE